MSTDNNRDEYAELLKYEIEMFFFTANKLRKKPGKSIKRNNAFFEAFLLHTRILVDFFLYGEKGINDWSDSIQPKNIIGDINAEDLKNTVEYSNLKKLFIGEDEKDKNDLNLRQRIHKRLAHLSKSRINYMNESNWSNTLTIIATIQCYIEKFNEKLPAKVQYRDTNSIFNHFSTIATQGTSHIFKVQDNSKK